MIKFIKHFNYVEAICLATCRLPFYVRNVHALRLAKDFDIGLINTIRLKFALNSMTKL